MFVALCPSIVTEVTALLSLTTAVNVIFFVCVEVERLAEDADAPYDEITGFWSSILTTVTVVVEVTLLPAASVTVAVNVSLWLPKL